MSETHRIVIKDGVTRFVYHDLLEPLMARLGAKPTDVTRASHVEPHPTRPGWIADMTPSDGPVIGVNGSTLLTGESVWPYGPHARSAWDALEPFRTRQEALNAERRWLHEERGL